jgi:uncharacterized protein YcbK (DUF882 family)
MNTLHFTLAELGGEAAPTEVQATLYRLMLLLEDARAICGGRPFHPTSGWRSPERNRAIGGSPTSQHPDGAAADLVVEGLPARQAWQILRESDLEVGQVIVYGLTAEGDGDGTFLHVSLPDQRRGLVDDWMWTTSRGGSGGPYHAVRRRP